MGALFLLSVFHDMKEKWEGLRIITGGKTYFQKHFTLTFLLRGNYSQYCRSNCRCLCCFPSKRSAVCTPGAHRSLISIRFYLYQLNLSLIHFVLQFLCRKWAWVLWPFRKLTALLQTHWNAASNDRQHPVCPFQMKTPMKYSEPWEVSSCGQVELTPATTEVDALRFVFLEWPSVCSVLHGRFIQQEAWGWLRTVALLEVMLLLLSIGAVQHADKEAHHFSPFVFPVDLC